MKNKPELLAPAGDLERLKIAILYGADAVYIGGPMLGLRANARNFTFEEIKEGVIFAHNHNARVHVTVNIVLHNKEIKEVINYLRKIEECGVDAIIVSDPAIIELAKKYTDLEIHLSTQQSTLNIEACKFFKKEGVKRIVLGREATKSDIKEIIDNVDIDIECFIHGAMCASISGRCVLSNIFTGRDANRGGCAQICRWDFDLLDGKDNKIEGEKPFTFCSKDLTMLKYIPDMIDMGIKSFKIEGRMRSIYYIATVVNIYRKVIDSYINDKEHYNYNKDYEIILRNCANRDAVAQFFNGVKDVTCSYYNGREEISNQDFIGIVLDYDKETKMATIEQRNYFKKGDELEIFGPNINIINITIDEIRDEENNIIDIVRHPRQIVKIKIEEEVHKFDMIRKKIKLDKIKNS
ncbi:MAG: U32 family peptidase [Bacilli bacterium]|nr:U32 family peptidase [Bacilli bacterium]